MPNFVPGDGPVPCPAMIIGEAPGANEDREGRPFVGRSGDLLNEALEAAGVSRSQVYVTNVYKHRPPNNRTPTDVEILEHAHYLREEFTAVEPLGVLLLGSTAMQEFFGKDARISKIRGLWIGGDEGRYYIATWHPSYVSRHGKTSKVREQFFEDVESFVNRTLRLAQ